MEILVNRDDDMAGRKACLCQRHGRGRIARLTNAGRNNGYREILKFFTGTFWLLIFELVHVQFRKVREYAQPSRRMSPRVLRQHALH